MSSNLTAEPIDRKKLDLGTGIKFVLRKLCGEPIDIIIDEDFIQILRGIAATGNEDIASDANKLINLIDKFGSVYLKEEY